MLVASLSKFLSSPSKSPRKRVSRRNPFSGYENESNYQEAATTGTVEFQIIQNIRPQHNIILGLKFFLVKKLTKQK
jgi:hypothetical protein